MGESGDAEMEVLSERYRVVRYDVRGFGRSERPTRPFSNVRDLRDLLGYLDIGATTIAGHSLGGQIAIDFALGPPDAVRA
jgi:pimeloyl-ACP methyl ester carboxylesterase